MTYRSWWTGQKVAYAEDCLRRLHWQINVELAICRAFVHEQEWTLPSVIPEAACLKSLRARLDGIKAWERAEIMKAWIERRRAGEAA